MAPTYTDQSVARERATSLGRHWTDYGTCAVTASLATTDEIPFNSFSGGRVYIPVGSSITSLTFYDAQISSKNGGVYCASYDSTGTAISIDVAGGQSFPIPADLFGAGAIKMVGDQAGNVCLSLKG